MPITPRARTARRPRPRASGRRRPGCRWSRAARAVATRDLSDVVVVLAHSCGNGRPVSVSQRLSAPSVSCTSRTVRSRPLRGSASSGSGTPNRADSEVAADAVEDVVDVEATELGLERRRPPPEVRWSGWSRRSMSRSPGSIAELALVDDAGQPGRCVRRAAPARSPGRPTRRGASSRRPAPGSPAARPPDRRARSDTGATKHAAHRQPRAYWVRSSIPASTNALRRSAHLLQRPQWRPPTGATHENVCSSGSSRPELQHLGLGQPRERCHDLELVPSASLASAANPERNSRLLSRTGCPGASRGRSCERRAGRTRRSSWRGATGCVPAGRRPRRRSSRRGCPRPRRSSERRTRRRSAAPER